MASAWGRLDDILGTALKHQQEIDNQLALRRIRSEQPDSSAPVAAVAESPGLSAPPVFRDAKPLSIPPLPVHLPEVTPVARVKNDTARYNQYAPEAAKLLYRTPMDIHFGPYDTDMPNEDYPGSSGSEGVGGFYRSEPAPVIMEDGSAKPPPSNFEIRVNGGWAAPDAAHDPYVDVLSHEFAHKWYHFLPDELRDSWSNIAQDIVSPYAIDRLQKGTEGGIYADATNPNELYAYNAERGPWEIDKSIRDYYYPGLYRQDMNPPVRGTYTLLPDEQARQYQDMAWIRTHNPIPSHPIVDQPYDAPASPEEISQPIWENGMKMPQYPYPQQWSKPEFPTLGMYANWFGYQKQ